MSDPLISIIVPVYNVEKYLAKCIESILRQSYSNFELILVDDGSKDKSGSICDEYAKRDNRIKVYHKQNGGVSSARNYGIDMATGDWICFVDSDDWVDEDYVLNMVANVKSDESFVITRHNFIGKNITYIDECHEIVGNLRIKFIIENNILNFSGPYCKLYNRNTIVKYKLRFPENIRMGEDGIFFTSYLNKTRRLTVLNINNYHYTDNIQSLSHRFYDFNSEYECYRTWKFENESLFKPLQNQDEYKRSVWYNRIGETFFRCILCLSRQEMNLSAKQIYQSLRLISDNDWYEFKHFYTPSTLKKQIVKKLFLINNFCIRFTLIKLDRLCNK